MILYFIRHGDPVYNPDSLTELGRKQAQALAKRLSLYGLDEIYSSTSNRAIETAFPTAQALNIKPIYLDWMNECYTWDEYTIKNEKGEVIEWIFHIEDMIDKLNDKEVRALNDKWYTHEYFKGFDYQKAIKRMNDETDKFLESQGYVHDRENGGYKVIKKNDKRIAIFAHQGFGLAFLSSLMDIPFPYFSTHFDLGHSSMTVIYFGESDEKYKTGNKLLYPKILELSNDSHLYKEEILTGYTNYLDI